LNENHDENFISGNTSKEKGGRKSPSKKFHPLVQKHKKYNSIIVNFEKMNSDL
jgi:hypothetical protein